MDYGDSSLNDLVIRAQNNDKKAMEELMKRFKPFIYKMISSIYIKGLDANDLEQLGYISIINAVRKFNVERSKNFTSYVTTAIRNDFYYGVRRKAKENYDISLYAPIEQDLEIKDMIPAPINLEQDYLEKESIEELKKIIKNLSKEERELLKVMLKGARGELGKYAEMKGISYSAVHKRKVKLIEKIKKEFVVKKKWE